MRKTLPPLPERTCRHCQKVFTPADPRQVFCRGKCCVAFHNAKALLARRLRNIEAMQAAGKALANG